MAVWLTACAVVCTVAATTRVSRAHQTLIDHKVTQLFVVGLPLERTVVKTASDAVTVLPDATVFVVEDACRAQSSVHSVEAVKLVSRRLILAPHHTRS